MTLEEILDVTMAELYSKYRTKAGIARKCGISSSAVAYARRKGSITWDILNTLCQAAGYDITIKKKYKLLKSEEAKQLATRTMTQRQFIKDFCTPDNQAWNILYTLCEACGYKLELSKR